MGKIFKLGLGINFKKQIKINELGNKHAQTYTHKKSRNTWCTKIIPICIICPWIVLYLYYALLTKTRTKLFRKL